MLVTPDRRFFVVDFRCDLAQAIPHARQMGDKLVIPYGHDEARLARNLGVEAPSPILARYDWPGRKPWDVQKATAAVLVESPRAYVLSTMGCGKTAAAIWAADYLRQSRKLGPVLVVAPLSTMTPVWERELFKLLPTAKVNVLYGSKSKRLELLRDPADFYIINHHGLGVILEELKCQHFGIVVVDELAVFRNKSTKLWKALATVVNAAEFAWGMTGAPTPQAPTDAWAQIRLLTPGRTTKTMIRFRDATMIQVSNFKWVPRPGAQDYVFAQMQPSVRFTRDDIGELPPTSFVEREVKLDSVAAKAYKLLFDKMRMATHDGQSITAVNEGVLSTKLLQVACGYIYTDRKGVFKLPNTARLDALGEVIDEADRKIIVFVPFVHALEGVSNHLRKQGHSVGVVWGGTSRAQRDAIFDNFQDKAEPRILVAHPQCMSHGLTLTAANTIIWYAPINSLETYEQANARIVRPSQTSKTFIVHLVGTPVERATYRRLKERSKLQGMLLELFRDQELEL